MYFSLAMNILQPETYLIGLIGLLVIVAILVGRQLLRVRRDEANLIRLEKGGASSSKNAAELYELGSVQLKKRLYPQATSTLKQAVKRLAGEPEEATAVIENALGFALAAQDDFQNAVNHYQRALKAKPNYPVAMNNLAFAKIRLNQPQEASTLYEEVLLLDPKNKTAIKQLKKIKTSVDTDSPNSDEIRGF